MDEEHNNYARLRQEANALLRRGDLAQITTCLTTPDFVLGLWEQEKQPFATWIYSRVQTAEEQCAQPPLLEQLLKRLDSIQSLMRRCQALPVSMESACLLMVLGNICCVQKLHLANAHVLATWAQAMMDKLPVVYSAASAEIWARLGQTYDSPEDQIKAYRHCLRITEKFDAAEASLLDWVILQLGKCYISLHDYPQAIDFFRRYLHVLSQRYGNCHVQEANILDYLGYLYHEAGDYPKARDCYQKELAIRRQLLSDTDIENVPIYIYGHLGMAFHACKEYQQALDCYQRYYKKRKEVDPWGWQIIAECHEGLGDLNQAITCYQKSLEMLRNDDDIYSSYFIEQKQDIKKKIEILQWMLGMPQEERKPHGDLSRQADIYCVRDELEYLYREWSNIDSFEYWQFDNISWFVAFRNLEPNTLEQEALTLEREIIKGCRSAEALIARIERLDLLPRKGLMRLVCRMLHINPMGADKKKILMLERLMLLEAIIVPLARFDRGEARACLLVAEQWTNAIWNRKRLNKVFGFSNPVWLALFNKPYFMNQIALAWLMCGLANIAKVHLQDLALAITFYQKALDIFAKPPGDFPDKIVQDWRGIIWCSMWDWDDESRYSGDDSRSPSLADESQCKYARLIQYHKNRLKIGLELYGKTSAKVADVWIDLGEAYSKWIKDYASALACYHEARSLYVLNDNAEPSCLLDQIAWLYEQLDDNGKALACYEQSLTLFLKHRILEESQTGQAQERLGRDPQQEHKQFLEVKIMTCRGRLQVAQGQWAEAERNWRQVMDLSKDEQSNWLDDSLDDSNEYSFFKSLFNESKGNLSRCLVEQNRFDEADAILCQY